MRLTLVLILLLFASLTSAQEYSIQRDDNDFATYEDIHSSKAKTPKKVLDAFKSIIKTKQSKSSTYSYKIVASAGVDIYALAVNFTGEKKVYLILYDKVKNKASDSPVVIDVKWAFNNEDGFSDKLLNYPLLTILNEDDNVVISVRERVHNGNIYNAVLNRRYLLNDHSLSLQLLFCYEESSVLPDGNIVRRLFDGDSTLNVYYEHSGLIQHVGFVNMNVHNGQITERSCEVEELCDFLFTTSGVQDELLLKSGLISPY